MSKENLSIADLEEATVTVAPEKTKKEKTPLTAEEIQALTDATEKVRAFGVSDEFSRVMTLVPMWHDTEGNAAQKTKVIESFGGSEKLKDYVDGPFQVELAVIGGLSKVASCLNNIKSFYARRDTTGTKKTKFAPVNIGGVPYLVNAEFLASLVGQEKDAKRTALLGHPETKQDDVIESL